MKFQQSEFHQFDILSPKLSEFSLLRSCNLFRRLKRQCLPLIFTVIIAVPSMPAWAQNSDEDSNFEVNIDTNISHGLTYRLKERDRLLIDSDPNGDDGNLNFDKGLISSVTKVTTEIDVENEDFGLFTRFTGFFDFKTEDGVLKRTRLSPKARKLVGSGAKLLDFYGYKDFEYGDVFGDFRVGNLVLNWGESTFVQNGVNVINPVDVSRLRTPGSQIREALVPVPLVAVSVAPTDKLSLESFVQLKWKKTEIDPVGTFFSTNDYVGEGGEYVELDLRGFGIPLPPDDQDNWLRVKRGPDRKARNSGQYGIALRYLSEVLNNAEFGFFFTRYHSRRPIVSARSGTATSLVDGATEGGTIATKAPDAVIAVVTAIANNTSPQDIATAIGTHVNTNFTTLYGIEKTQLIRQLTGTALQLKSAGAEPQTQVTALTNYFKGFAAQIGIDRYVKDAHYFVEYPEEINVFGVSFNTLLGNTGWALQGEISHHTDAPLQREDTHVIAEGLRPINNVLNFQSRVPRECAELNATECTGVIAQSLGATGVPVVGGIRRDVSQIQVTGTKTFGSVLSADSGVFLIEAALTNIHKMPDSAITPLDGPGGSYGTASSWGYRAVTKLDYFNAVGAFNLHPYIQFQHDVNGTTPNPISNFVEDAKTFTLGVGANYLQEWEANLSYTRHFGAGERNTLRDRDFLEFSLSYSF